MKTHALLRILLTTGLFLCLGLTQMIHAQTNITAFGSYGASDVQISGLGILDVLDPYIKPISQYTAGLQWERELSRHFSFATGAQYTSRGFTSRDNFNIKVIGLDLPVDARIDTRLQYVEVPLMLKYKIADGAVIPYVRAGATAGYAVSGKFQPKVNAIINWNLPAININLEDNMYNRFDISGVVGAGVSIPVSESGAIQFDINYRHSLNDMFADKITDIRIKTYGISAGIGYTMSF